MAVLGAAGGAGLAAVEIAKLMGARVIAVASSPEKLAVTREHGADEAVDYGAYDLKEGLRALTGGRGVDVVYDCVGGDSSEAALRAIGWQGRFLVVGFASGDIPKIPLNLLLLKGCEAIGVFWGEAVKRDPAGHRANMRQVLDWVAAGAAQPAHPRHLSAGRHRRGDRRHRSPRSRRQGRADALIRDPALVFRHSLPCCGDACAPVCSGASGGVAFPSRFDSFASARS